MKSRFRSVKRNTRLISLIARASGQIKLPARPLEIRPKISSGWWRKGLASAGIHLRHLDAFKPQFDIGQHRALNAGKEPSHLLTNSLMSAMWVKVLVELRHLGGEERFGRYRWQPCTSAHRPNRGAELRKFRLRAEIAVG